MWFGEPHPFPERGSPTRLSMSDNQVTKGDRAQERIHIMVYWCHTTHIRQLSDLRNLLKAKIILVYWSTIHWSGVWNEYFAFLLWMLQNETHCFDINICMNMFLQQFNLTVIKYFCQTTLCYIPVRTVT
jgi:hypothetical protein